MNAHTPGPWNIYEYRRGSDKWIIGKPVAYGWSAIAETTDAFGNPDVTLANARLIAAAPETAKERDTLHTHAKALADSLEGVLTSLRAGLTITPEHMALMQQSLTALAQWENRGKE